MQCTIIGPFRAGKTKDNEGIMATIGTEDRDRSEATTPYTVRGIERPGRVRDEGAPSVGPL